MKGWKSSAGWGFPKGKINKDEPEAPCAIREVAIIVQLLYEVANLNAIF